MTIPRQKSGVQLSPPQNIYFSKILNSVGNDPLVQVNPLRQVSSNRFLITVRVRGNRKARALATLLVLNKRIGNILIQVRILNSKGDLIRPIRRSFNRFEIARLYRIAFRTNRLFSFAVSRTLPVRAVFPVFKAKVVQFFADNLADLFRNLNEVAAFVFRDVLKQKFKNIAINFSTVQQPPEKAVR
ncbi:hypothetical protein [Paenibacillus tyrfis]|uniref:hypothetical protein n=1 Tax=Paenibacillus tyrfis TaxID=1501230 RepID=UPI000B58C602|nr:hypothetical protein [Paenibacillus tyrfis]